MKELRLLTKPDGTSRGCAFVEFTSSDYLRKALKLHHSTIPGKAPYPPLPHPHPPCPLTPPRCWRRPGHGDRKINVELTAGGGGNKSEFRLKKIKERNDRLAKQRQVWGACRALGAWAGALTSRGTRLACAC